jgi:hypothetical protein
MLTPDNVEIMGAHAETCHRMNLGWDVQVSCETFMLAEDTRAKVMPVRG